MRYAIEKINNGSHIYIISDIITRNPQSLMNALRPMGDTLIGVHGEKYRVLSNGDNRAMPNPPSVKASRMP